MYSVFKKTNNKITKLKMCLFIQYIGQEILGLLNSALLY